MLLFQLILHITATVDIFIIFCLVIIVLRAVRDENIFLGTGLNFDLLPNILLPLIVLELPQLAVYFKFVFVAYNPRILPIYFILIGLQDVGGLDVGGTGLAALKD